MPIVPQYATETTDGSGDAVFIFPPVPQGALWCGTTTIPAAPSSAVGMVLLGGQVIGAFFGPGSYGPWTADYSQPLSLSVTGLNPHTQYQAIWHADTKGAEFSVYPAPITPTVVTGGSSVTVTNFPAIQTVDGTVTANQGSPPWEVQLDLATTVNNGQETMTGSSITLPMRGAVEGVSFSAPTTNAHPIFIGNPPVTLGSGYCVNPGGVTPLFPVNNSAAFACIGTASDVLTFLVT